MSKTSDIRSDIAWSTPDRVVIRGLDLSTDILGHMDLGDFAYFHLKGVKPTEQESRMFNALFITLVEHGITPSVLAARLTYAGAPESLQAAVAAGLAGLGSVFVGSTEGAARLLSEALEGRPADADLSELASQVVADARTRGVTIPGIGHPMHKPQDPRAVRLFEIAEDTGFSRRHVALMKLVADEASRELGKELPVNATGAIGSISCELGFPWRVVRGIGVAARAIGLVAHILEEGEQPLALEVWRRAETDATAHLRG